MSLKFGIASFASAAGGASLMKFLMGTPVKVLRQNQICSFLTFYPTITNNYDLSLCTILNQLKKRQ